MAVYSRQALMRSIILFIVDYLLQVDLMFKNLFK